MAEFNPKLLDILVCPETKEKLSYDAEKQILVSQPSKKTYPIRDGIPIMLTGEALAANQIFLPADDE